ncbi:hypothetical protein HHI36_017035, partial [Cryptolaemus montrouzieri]
MSDSDDDIPKKKKRGARNAEKYIHIVIKTAKIKGLPHVSHRGKQLPGRRTGETCRQLWVYEFYIHNMKTGKGTFYSYHEEQALKGANEVSTFLNHY